MKNKERNIRNILKGENMVKIKQISPKTTQEEH